MLTVCGNNNNSNNDHTSQSSLDSKYDWQENNAKLIHHWLTKDERNGIFARCRRRENWLTKNSSVFWCTKVGARWAQRVSRQEKYYHLELEASVGEILNLSCQQHLL